MSVFINVVALLSVLLFASRTSLGQAPESCNFDNEGHHFCQDCRTGVNCVSLNVKPEVYVTCTHPGEACAIVEDTSTCVPVADSPCSCDKTQQCDHYDSDAVFLCLDGGQNLFVSPCLYQQTCINGVCDYLSDELCTGTIIDGYVVVKPECTSAVYCLADSGASSGIFNCSTGQYFDPELEGCATSPPVPCDGGCKGACSDKADCSRYYVCDGNGNVIDIQNCDNPSIPYYNPATKSCQKDKTLCTITADCNFL